MLSNPRPSLIATDLPAASSFPRTEAIRTAMLMRDLLLSGKVPATSADTPAEMIQQVSEIKKMFAGEDTVAGKGDRSGRIIDTFMNMAPFLSPKELETVWKTLESGRGFPAFLPVEKNWVSLFKAMGNRDAKSMAHAAHTLLAGGEQMPIDIRYYLVAAEMLGSITSGDKPAAIRIWSSYRQNVSQTTVPKFLFRLLESAASSKTTRPVRA